MLKIDFELAAFSKCLTSIGKIEILFSSIPFLRREIEALPDHFARSSVYLRSTGG